MRRGQKSDKFDYSLGRRNCQFEVIIDEPRISCERSHSPTRRVNLKQIQIQMEFLYSAYEELHICALH